jgi:hypothetical protein
MNTSNLFRCTLSALLLLTLLDTQCSTFAQGSLTPPGAPAATMKTLQQIEPRAPISVLPTVITSSGSYYIVSNLVGSAGSDGITVAANNVTIDLRGFTLVGPASALAENGIDCGSRSNIFILHGTVSGWNGSGIGGSARYCRVIDLTAADNGRSGIRTGDYSLVQHCIADRNGLNSSGQIGIGIGSGAIVRDCVVSGHNGASSIGISGGGNCLVEHCNISGNNSAGGSGIDANGSSLVVDCVVAGNLGTTNNVGIFVNSKSQVKHCVISGNSGDGMRVIDTCLILENECSGNGGHGINATGSGSRIDGNSLTSNSGFGLQVTTASGSNLIVRNSAYNNSMSAYSIASGNKDALILSPGSGFASTGPWVNFSY